MYFKIRSLFYFAAKSVPEVGPLNGQTPCEINQNFMKCLHQNSEKVSINKLDL